MLIVRRCVGEGGRCVGEGGLPIVVVVVIFLLVLSTLLPCAFSFSVFYGHVNYPPVSAKTIYTPLQMGGFYLIYIDSPEAKLVRSTTTRFCLVLIYY